MTLEPTIEVACIITAEKGENFMKVRKVSLYLIVFSLLLSLIQAGFADAATEENRVIMKPSHFKCQIMRDQGLSRYDKIILLQLIHRKANAETRQVFSKMECDKSWCNEMTCIRPENWMDKTRCHRMQLQAIIGSAGTSGRALGIPLLDPVVHLVGIHWARGYDHTKSQDDMRLWFGWGRVIRWYQ